MSVLEIAAREPSAFRMGRFGGWSLASKLAAEDNAEDQDGLSPHERLTCRLHRRWAHQCIASPAHVIPVTGHRWCRGCRTSTSVAVDELSATVTLTCRRCGQASATRAAQQIIRSCQASIGAARRLRNSATPKPRSLAGREI
jgi:hypothetical protein